jgi:hypothetical protein
MERRVISETTSQKNFILAGKAIFTVENESTGNRFTYKVNKHAEKDLHFVSLLSGPNNDEDYVYLGTIFDKETFKKTKSAKISEDAQSFKVFRYIWARLLQEAGLPEQIRFWHEGRCCRCGRRLTVPESIERGIGPECASKI